jgi:hypothetical protein
MALFYGGLAQFLAGMWEFVAGNTFGATGESCGSFPIIHSWVIQGWRFMVHLTCECTTCSYAPGVAHRASSKLLYLSNCCHTTEAEITFGLCTARGPPLSVLLTTVIACSVLLLWCILALIRGHLHPRLGYRRCLQDRVAWHGR